ncbi:MULTISPECIES: hypothetical protein [Providencia]|uniref:Uncharacterized protein n=1 Tax=Providencia rettgeri TaxID=587 RepID=A0AB35LA59_PRORE|nr:MULTISPECIES: hypothetical protein [Providencia]MDE4734102.1 hypothetical protein [Providencia rettgeri]MDH2305577.1 hypothetical protein [Providencia rettgeri]
MYKASIIIASLLFSTLASATSLESQLSSKNIMTFSAEYSLHNGGNGGKVVMVATVVMVAMVVTAAMADMVINLSQY